MSTTAVIAEMMESHAAPLLRPGESEVPPSVRRTEQFFRSLGLWFQLSRNLEARSCRDAAHKRQRLGHEGIPLWDELKSFFGRYVNSQGRVQLVVVHCRADHRLDMAKVAAVLGVPRPPERVTEEELQHFRLEYGRVNPFETWEFDATKPFTLDMRFIEARVVQVFDDDLLQPIGVPGTVMTNAGDLTWAVEFFPWELVKRLEGAMVAEISEPDPEETPRLWGVKDDRPIGILTGNPPEAGMLLWQRVNEHVRALLGDNCCGDVSMPRVEMLSIPELGLTMELESREAPAWAGLEKGTRELVSRGVKLLALPCNTTSYFAPQIHELCAGTETQFLSMPEVTGRWLRAHGVREVALVGINYVADLGGWSAYREPLAGLNVELLTDEEAKTRIRELAYMVKVEGANQPGVSRLRDIFNRYIRSQYVVLASTELSLLLDFQKKGARSERVLIDPMQLYAEALAREYLGIAESKPSVP